MKSHLAGHQHPRKYRRLLHRRADLLSLIFEMQKNPVIQAAAWQITSLINSLHKIDQQLQVRRSARV